MISAGRFDGGGIDADFLRTRLDHLRGIFQRANAAANGEGHENLLGDLLDHFQQDRPAFVPGGNVEKDELVGTIRFIPAGNFDRIAGIAQIDEMNALDHPAAIDVQTGNDALGEQR